MIKFETVTDTHRKIADTEIKLPQRSSANSAGYDFYSPCDCVINPGEIKTVWTDVKACMNSNNVLLIYPRSSMGKKKIVLANGTGVVDSDYYNNPDNDGNIGIMLYNYGNAPFTINTGDKIAQGVFVNYLTTENDNAIGQRSGGFGSTGK